MQIFQFTKLKNKYKNFGNIILAIIYIMDDKYKYTTYVVWISIVHLFPDLLVYFFLNFYYEQ